MVFKLKNYQENTLNELRRYLKAAKSLGADVAFYAHTNRPYYPVQQLPDLPYVCVRIPTGGGKTVLAAHSIGIVTAEFLDAERSVVLWLAPSNAIVQQTLEALQDEQHPYRQALEAGCPGGVSVMNLKEALYIDRGTVDGETVVLLSTLQALRVDETEGRKIYETNGRLAHHFSGLSERQKAMLGTGEEAERFSLANVLRLRRPIVIVDEAHNARTPLSFDTLERFNPPVILEFTATPDQENSPSNIVHHVSASELKAAAMIKLPIRLQTLAEWKQAVAAAVTKQHHLETLARESETHTGEYIRPVVLFQARPQSATNESANWEALKNCLMNDLKIPKEEIAVQTGTVRELDAAGDMKSRDCKIKYVITVSALKEGWDCPFAYVLCSVQNLSSSTAVEQILGRVLRMPGAVRKQHDDLNFAYAYATSTGFTDSAKGLEDALIQSGFERFEAKANIKSLQGEIGFERGVTFHVTVTEPIPEEPNLEKLPEHLKAAIHYEPITQEITYTGAALTDDDTKAIQECAETDEGKRALQRLALKSSGRDFWPSARGETFAVPELAVRIQGKLELFEDQFKDFVWKLADCNACLTEEEFSAIEESRQAADIDISDQGRIETRFVAELHEQLSLLEMRGPQTPAELGLWLDRQILHPDVPIKDSQLFLMEMVQYLVDKRNIPVDKLVRLRFRLRDAATKKIDEHRKTANARAFETYLFEGMNESIEVDPSVCFEFPNSYYPANRYYKGSFTFPKHFYECPAEMNSEEEKCAVLIETSPKVRYWVRNVERSEYSYWLPTSTDRFFPDFVVRLSDGRWLVIEYKGEHLLTARDAQEKNRVGMLWEAKSGGKCIFRMVGKGDMEPALRPILN
jgi:type III restriction enzyme